MSDKEDDLDEDPEQKRLITKGSQYNPRESVAKI